MTRPLRVIVGCETSGAVRRAIAARGHDVWSVDLLPADDGSNRHIVGDVRDHLNDGWDLGVFHPTCTFLCNSGVSWLHKDESRWAKLDDGATLFNDCLNAPIPHVAVENPIMHEYAIERIGGVKQSQVVQPYMFGHLEQKATCFWLKNLPLLCETNNVKAQMLALPDNQRQRLHYLPPGPDRWKERSKTFAGIAEAIADQWCGYAETTERPTHAQR